MYIYIHTYVNICTHVNIRICIYVRTYTKTYNNTNTHTHILTPTPSPDIWGGRWPTRSGNDVSTFAGSTARGHICQNFYNFHFMHCVCVCVCVYATFAGVQVHLQVLLHIDTNVDTYIWMIKPFTTWVCVCVCACNICKIYRYPCWDFCR